MRYETVKITLDGHVGHVALNRPAKLNAMSGLMFEEIGAAVDALCENPEVRAIVLSGGESKHFTVGLDLKEAAGFLMEQAKDPARHRDRLRRHVKNWQHGLDAADRARVPVIAAIHNACIGGGVDMITACDIRLCTKDSFFSIKEIDVGIVADVGTLQRIGHLLPNGLVRELAYTGREFKAEEAKSYGFVNTVYDTKDDMLEGAFALAKMIASKSPMAMTGTKAVLNHARENSIQSGLEYVATWNSAMLLGDDVQKAAMAMLSKAEVEFENLLSYETAIEKKKKA
ncbi:crotonase/enoyl-CoA hydratase family protein [Temperatibacter marinus]|uniref:Crotonase/enoyl-CoA hydratase family protein n=1 Tax=Temperatibacter marinus TaxID=1456591 RepID=A0AA52EK10_9PROT|nr:crotonase/enoyl-CoA hydratase family protein [Temperatibacter marinus]WND03942.1 crotonase/enoyl-CoA hydratase family protein [Temperatibacter marinus]